MAEGLHRSSVDRLDSPLVPEERENFRIAVDRILAHPEARASWHATRTEERIVVIAPRSKKS